MSPKTSAEKPFLTVESLRSPFDAIDKGIEVAKVRGKVGFALEMAAPGRWRVRLEEGSMEDLKKAIRLARGVKWVEI